MNARRRPFAIFAAMLAVLVLLAGCSFGTATPTPSGAAPAATTDPTAPAATTVPVTPSSAPSAAPTLTPYPTQVPLPTQAPLPTLTPYPTQAPPAAAIAPTATAVPSQPGGTKPSAAPAVKTLPEGVTDLGNGVGCVDPKVVAKIINRYHAAGNDPGPAARELDTLFDQSASQGVFIGQHAADVNFTFRPAPQEGGSGSIVFWHNALNGGPNKLDTGPNAKMMGLFLQGTYGIYGAWDTHVKLVNNDGRSAWTCSYLNPEQMLDYWGK